VYEGNETDLPDHAKDAIGTYKYIGKFIKDNSSVYNRGGENGTQHTMIKQWRNPARGYNGWKVVVLPAFIFYFE
jgi:hypothetical protein